MAASPFATTSVSPLILIRGTTRTPLPGCVVKTGDNKARSEEWGVDHCFTIKAQIPKALITTQPRVDLDAVEYAGRQYKITMSSGDEAHSSAWAIGGTCPMKQS